MAARLARAAVFAMLAVAMGGTARGAEQRADADWRTITTAHYRIHFPAPFEPWATEMARRVESIHGRVTGIVGYMPGPTIDVVVMDPIADSNGMALPFLDRPAIVLWTHPPEAESVIGDYRDFAELLVTHEVTHVVHLTRPRNRSRGILARLSPAPLGPLSLRAPRWVTEGYATLVEGELTGSGRPHGAFRAMVLRRFAVAGKLPSYGSINRTSGFMGGSMAYLVGSTFLEWLADRDGADSLPRLWKRMASRRGGSFDTCFRAVFGEAPADLYDRFTAEVTAQAIEEEHRLEAAGIAAGEAWQKLDGLTADLQVSSDGAWLLTRRIPKRGRSHLAIWSIVLTEEERQQEERRQRAEAKLLEESAEVPDRLPVPRPRKTLHRLEAIDGQAPEDARFIPATRSVLFTLKGPDAEGVLRPDLYVWDVEGGGMRRITNRADVSMADPAPDGTWAVAVRSRHGMTELVRVDLAGGTVTPITVDDAEPFAVWNHPRVSPDGNTIVALRHQRGVFRLLALPAAGGAARELPLRGSPAGPPAFSPDGKLVYETSDWLGAWNVESQALDGSGASELVTRVVGGALSPAPTPDGEALFMLDVAARGVDIRRLELGAALAPHEPGPYPVEPPPPTVATEPESTETPAAHAYRARESAGIRTIVGSAIGPDGSSLELGVHGIDAIGRLDWVAMISGGDGARPYGATATLAWHGLPVTLALSGYHGRYRPGSQRLLDRAPLDRDETGLFLDARLRRTIPHGSVAASLGIGAARVVPKDDAATNVTRALATGSVRLVLRTSRGRHGVVGALTLGGATGRTTGDGWSRYHAGVELTGFGGWGSVSLLVRAGDMGGDPTVWDLWSVGGGPDAIAPDGLRDGQVVSAALPSHVQLGERFAAARLAYTIPGLPLSLFAAGLDAWTPSAARPDPVIVWGLELDASTGALPLALPGSLASYAGIARVTGDEPELDGTVFYGGLRYRP